MWRNGTMTFEDFVAKVKQEGGVEAALDQGLTSDDLSPAAAAANRDFVKAWDLAAAAHRDTRKKFTQVQQIMDTR